MLWKCGPPDVCSCRRCHVISYYKIIRKSRLCRWCGHIFAPLTCHLYYIHSNTACAPSLQGKYMEVNTYNFHGDKPLSYVLETQKKCTPPFAKVPRDLNHTSISNEHQYFHTSCLIHWWAYCTTEWRIGHTHTPLLQIPHSKSQKQTIQQSA